MVVNLSSLRAFRVLRAFKTINIVPGNFIKDGNTLLNVIEVIIYIFFQNKV